MRKLFITICELDEVSYLSNGAHTELFSAPLYEHAYRKIKDAANKLDLEVEFVRAATFNVKGATNEFDPDFEDIVAVVSPLVFLSHARCVEDALNFVIKNDPAYATVGSARNPAAVFGLGKMISGGAIGSCHDFIHQISECGAVYKNIALAEGEKTAPVSRIEYFKRVEEYRNELIDYLIMTGVVIEQRDGVVIAPNTEIRRGTKIEAGVQIGPMTIIKENCKIGQGSVIVRSEIGADSTIRASQIADSSLEDGVRVGPFCLIEGGSRIFSGSELQSHVTVLNSVVGMESRIGARAQICDTETGTRAQIGAGTTFVNHASIGARRCRLGDNVTIGAGSTLIAPLAIGSNAFVAAGSVITDDVPSNALAVAREYQTNREGWAKKRKKK